MRAKNIAVIERAKLITQDFFLFPDLTAERMPPPSKRPDRSEVLEFDQNKLHHVPTTEKVVLPTKQGKLINLLSTFQGHN